MDSFRALCSQWWIVVGPVRNCCWDIWNTLIIFFGNVDWGKQNMARTLHFFEVKPGHLTLPSWQCCLILKPTSLVLQRCQTGISVLKCSGLLCALPPNHPQQIVAIVTLSSLVLYFNLKTKQSSWISLHHTETYYIYSLEPWWLAFLYNTFTPKNSLLILMHHHCSTEHSSEDLLGLDVKLREIPANLLSRMACFAPMCHCTIPYCRRLFIPSCQCYLFGLAPWIWLQNVLLQMSADIFFVKDLFPK